MTNYAGTRVRIFFVISGSLITSILLNEYSQTSTINLRQFYIRRAYRILPAAAVFMLFAMLMYWHELRWYDIGAMLLYLANFDGARPWMVMHLWSLCVEEQFYRAWPGVRLRSFWESSRSLPSTALVVIISKFQVADMGHFPRSPTTWRSVACWRYSVRASHESGSGRRFPCCSQFF
jgi:peptidoglycan/LPS O-acetylase OafA/YrhL